MTATEQHGEKDDVGGDDLYTEGGFTVANEFTGVVVRKWTSQQGERLELFVPKTGVRVRLDAMQLEIIAAQPPSRWSELFAEQLGSQQTEDSE
jgi:hypothetical protein